MFGQELAWDLQRITTVTSRGRSTCVPTRVCSSSWLREPRSKWPSRSAIVDRNSAYYAWHAVILMGATTMLGAVLAVALGGAWVGTSACGALIEKTRRIGEGDLTSRSTWIARMNSVNWLDAINAMCEQLRLAQGKIAQEAGARIAARRAVAACRSAAHRGATGRRNRP